MLFFQKKIISYLITDFVICCFIKYYVQSLFYFYIIIDVYENKKIRDLYNHQQFESNFFILEPAMAYCFHINIQIPTDTTLIFFQKNTYI